MKDLITELGGAIPKVFMDDDTKPEFRFFKPYQSASDFALRSTSVITGPVVITAVSAYSALLTAWMLTKSIANLAVLNTGASKEAFKKFLVGSAVSLIGLVLAIASPAINAVDLIGGGINSIFGKSSNEHSISDSDLLNPTFN